MTNERTKARGPAAELLAADPGATAVVPAAGYRHEDPPAATPPAPGPHAQGDAAPGCPGLTAALAAARDRCRAAEKNARNAFHRYDYASADEVIATASEALAGSGLALIPTREELTVLGGTVFALNRTLLLSHEGGEFVPLEVRGWPVIQERGRPLDKAYATALTSSLAYKLRDLLQMPRSKQEDDVSAQDDRDTPRAEPGPAGGQDPEPADLRAFADAASGPSIAQPAMATQVARIEELLAACGVGEDGRLRACRHFGAARLEDLTCAQAGQMIGQLQRRLAERQAPAG